MPSQSFCRWDSVVHFHQSKCPGRHRRMSRRLLIGSQRSDAVYSYRLNSSKNIDGSIFNRIEYSTRANRCARMPSKIFFVSLYNYPSFHTKISHDNCFMFTKKKNLIYQQAISKEAYHRFRCLHSRSIGLMRATTLFG